jgi:cysteine synthase A
VSKGRIYWDIEEMVNGEWPTPLLRLRAFHGRNVWAKLEFFNVFSRSIKDRTAYGIFNEIRKKTREGEEIVEASSGNMAVSLASFSIIYKRKLTAFIPKGAPKVFISLLKLLGTKVIEMEGNTTTLLPKVKEYSKTNGVYHPNQFENSLNYIVHEQITAREIEEQIREIERKPRMIIGSVGTSGHMTGISRYFYDKGYEIVLVEPAEGDSIPGLKRLNSNNPFIREIKYTKIVDVSLEESLEGVIKVTRSDGIVIGVSSGAVVACAEKINAEDAILIFPDDGYKYLDIIMEYIET